MNPAVPANPTGARYDEIALYDVDLTYLAPFERSRTDAPGPGALDEVLA